MGKTAIFRDKKRIALIARDNKKKDVLEWAKFNITKLKLHVLYAQEPRAAYRKIVRIRNYGA